MVRTVIIPENTHIQLDIPEEYVGKQIEITYLALDEFDAKPKKTRLGDFFGTISNETAEKLRQHVKEVRSEWDRDI